MKKKKQENYLDKIVTRCENISWNEDENGIVTLEIENKGIYNTIFQKLFKKPRISYIHLDEIGSYVWKKLDANTTLFEIGKVMEKELGEKASPTYERLVRYIEILNSYHFIQITNN